MSKRPITATLFRGNEVVWTRTYNRLSTAIPRAVQLALLDGKEGIFNRAVEFSHTDDGWLLATLKIKRSGSYEVELSDLAKRYSREMRDLLV